MSNYLINGETLTNIANAIRTKTGKTDSIPTENMASEISGLPIYPLYDGAVEEINLAYTLNSDGKSYSVSGIGNVTATDIVIPATYNGLPVTQISTNAFEENAIIATVYIPDTVTRVNNKAFMNCSNLQSIRIGNNVDYIGWNVFYNCDKISSLSIPDSVTDIGEGSCSRCYLLRSITVGSGVKTIGYDAFYDDYNLKEITIYATTPPTIKTSLFKPDKIPTIYVPAESVEAYKTATNWSAYADKIQAIQN